jgi:myo-inositol-1(or 4)-monophosphatase
MEIGMDIKSTAIRAAREAGALLKARLGTVERVEFKGAVDLVTEMDKLSEDLLKGAIRKAFPDHGILTEESREEVSSGPYRWIIDPLDGTTNYAHGFPMFCVSIAFEERGSVRFGVVYDPMLDELFTGVLGGGAFLNDKKISVSTTASLDKSLLATGFPYDVRTSKENNLDHFARFAVRAQAIRRAGSAALDLSYIASGRFDGFWEMKLHPWDVAAGSLFIVEAGGRVTDFKGGAFSIHSAECLATNGFIHAEMAAVLNMGGGGPGGVG